MSPSITHTTISSPTAVQVFSGTGKVRLSSLNGNVRFGDSSLDPSDSKTWLDTSQPFSFCAPATVYAAVASGSDSAKVEVWF